MNWKIYTVLVFLIFFAGYVLAHNDSHGPFPPDAKIERIPLTKLSPVPQTNERQTNFVFVVPGEKETRLQVTSRPVPKKPDEIGLPSEGFWVAVTVAGRQVLPLTQFSDFAFVSGLTAYSVDLNQDRVPDFVIYSYSDSGGCGLASGYCDVAFILSAGDKYTLATVKTLFPDDGDFVILNKKACFIHTSYHYGGICNDSRYHNFWIYNLLVFGKDGIKVANSIHPAFPKTIRYCFRSNHSETTIITDELRATMQKQSLTRVFRKEDGSNLAFSVAVASEPGPFLCFKDLQACFQYILDSERKDLPSRFSYSPPHKDIIFKIEKLDSFLLQEGTHRRVIVIDPDDLTRPYLHTSTRGAQGNGAYYLFTPIQSGFRFVGMICGNAYTWKMQNGKAQFTTYSHMSASSYIESVYDWAGMMFKETSRILHDP